MNPAIFVVLGLLFGILNRSDRVPDLGMRSWAVVAFAGALFYLIPIGMFVLPAWMLPAGVPIGCLLGTLVGYALARQMQHHLEQPRFR